MKKRFKMLSILISSMLFLSSCDGITSDDSSGSIDNSVQPSITDSENSANVYNNLTYEVINSNITITGVVDNSVKVIKVPKIIRDYSVSEIEQGAFEDCANLEKIEVPFVGENAETTSNNFFSYIFGGTSYEDNQYLVPSSLTEVIITGGSTIGESAFYECASLVTVLMSMDITSIESSAFSRCMSLMYVNINSNITSLSEKTFSWCTSLKSISIPDSVTSIGGYAFSNCRSLESIILPDSVEVIGEHTFYNCMSMSFVEIPDSVTSIGEGAFASCYALTSITIPNSVTTIGHSALYSCSGLTSVSIPFVGENLDGTGKTYFISIFGSPAYTADSQFLPDSLTTVNVTGGTTITENAFYNCDHLTSITVANSVTSIGKNAFYNCSSLTSISLPFVGESANGYTNTHFGYVFGSSSFSENGEYVPDSLKTVNITGGTSIFDNAFSNCSSLTSVTVSKSVTRIGLGAFYNCSGLTSISLPFVGEVAGGTNNRFFGYIFGATAIENNNDNIPISLTEVNITGGTTIGDYVFLRCISIETVTIADSVKSIGNSSFYSCDSLTTINFPSKVTSIGNSAFAGCNGLTSIVLPDSVASIGTFAFQVCQNLESIVIPAGVTNIEQNVFYKCDKLTKIYYTGDSTAWDAIDIAEDNDHLDAKTIYYYSETNPTGSGHYWHYLNGEIVEW